MRKITSTLPLALGISASAMFYLAARPLLAGISAAVGLAGVLTWSLMFNHFRSLAEQRPNRTGDTSIITPSEVDAIPYWLVFLDFSLTTAAIGLVIAAVVIIII